MALTTRQSRIVLRLIEKSNEITKHEWFESSIFRAAYVDIGCAWTPDHFKNEKELKEIKSSIRGLESLGIIRVRKAHNYKGRNREKIDLTQTVKDKVLGLDKEMIIQMIESANRENYNLLIEIFKSIITE